MKILKDRLNNYIKIEKQINIIMNLILSDKTLQQFIIDLNTKEQLFKEGIKSDNTVLGSYSPYTYSYKVNKFGEFPRHITLFEKGKFYGSFRIYLKKDYFIIDADGQKDDKNLFQVYGENILGLTEESKEKLREKIKPIFSEKLKNYYGN